MESSSARCEYRDPFIILAYNDSEYKRNVKLLALSDTFYIIILNNIGL
jgi:hypothetical protein